MQLWGTKKTDRFRLLARSIVLSILLTAAPLLMVPQSVFAGTLVENRYDMVSDPGVNAAATHNIGFTYTDMATPVGSILLEFCSNSPIIGDSCTPPAGLDLTSVGLAAQAGETGFSIDPASTASTLILTRPAQLPTAGPSSYRFDNVINPSTPGTYFLKIQTFTSTDATGLNVQEGGVALSTSVPLTVSAEVPPYLRFCAAVTIVGFDCGTATSYFIDLGEFSTNQPTAASTELVAATNAGSGYSITVTGTTLTSGNNVITPLASQAGSNPGTSQFGMNIRANSSPSIGAEPAGPGTAAPTPSYGTANQFRFGNGDVIVSAAGSNDNRKFTVSYLANISTSQPAGVYATTLTYICLANF